MANRPRSRKRVQAIRRAPNGSAFQSCVHCATMVPVALADMHECRVLNNVKRFRGILAGPYPGRCRPVKAVCSGEPRSGFRVFMESFVDGKTGNWIDLDRKGFETWKNLSEKERQPYLSLAEMVNTGYMQELIEDEGIHVPQEDDEADSAMVGKFDPDPWAYDSSEHCYDTSDVNSETYESEGTKSLSTYERKWRGQGLF